MGRAVGGSLLCSQRQSRLGPWLLGDVSCHPLAPLRRLDELNLSWCFDFTERHVQVAVAHVSATVTQLNLSGYRKNLQRAGERGLLVLPSPLSRSTRACAVPLAQVKANR